MARAVAAAGTAAPATGGSVSSAKRQMRLGFQKSRKIMVQRSEKSPAVMSTKLLSMWLDQKNCMDAKEIPTTRMAGRTSNVSLHATDHGVHVRFGKKCDGGEHVHWRDDGPPSHRRRVGDEVQRGGMEGLEAQTDHEGTGDGHRRTESCAALDEGAEAESNEQKLQTAIRGDAADGGLHDLEVSGADRDVVEKDGGNDNPHDVH